MATIRTIQDIKVWHLARRLAKEIYRVSDIGSFRKDFPLRSQIRRASVSVVSNISEGFERDGNREFIQFLSQAKGSAGEVLGQLHIALDLRYCDDATFRGLRATAIQTLRMLDNLIMYLRDSGLKGKKFNRKEQ